MDWQASCNTQNVRQDGARNVQDYTKHGPLFLSRRNPADGGAQPSRSEVEARPGTLVSFSVVLIDPKKPLSAKRASKEKRIPPETITAGCGLKS